MASSRRSPPRAATMATPVSVTSVRLARCAAGHSRRAMASTVWTWSTFMWLQMRPVCVFRRGSATMPAFFGFRAGAQTARRPQPRVPYHLAHARGAAPGSPWCTWTPQFLPVARRDRPRSAAASPPFRRRGPPPAARSRPPPSAARRTRGGPVPPRSSEAMPPAPGKPIMPAISETDESKGEMKQAYYGGESEFSLKARKNISSDSLSEMAHRARRRVPVPGRPAADRRAPAARPAARARRHRVARRSTTGGGAGTTGTCPRRSGATDARG